MKANIDLNDPSPLYKQVETDLKEKIKNNKIKSGEAIGSHQDLSEKYGVSVITIKRAILNLSREGLVVTRKGKGTYAAEQRAEKEKILTQSKTIGLVLQDLKHPFFSMIVRSVEERVYELGYTLLLSGSSNKLMKEESQIKHFQKIGVDGLIIASLSLDYSATPYIRSLHEENYSYVMLSYIHDPQFWFVGSDHEIGSYSATEHLIKQGYEKIGFVHPGKGNLLGEVRKNGYSKALIDYNIPFNWENIFYLQKEEYDSDAKRLTLGFSFGKEFLKIKNKPEALFFYDDTSALGFIKCMIENNIKVPEDIAVIGYDDIDLAQYASVPLTTIKQPVEDIGYNAVNVIDARIKGVDVMNRTVFTPKLIVRESSKRRVK